MVQLRPMVQLLQISATPKTDVVLAALPGPQESPGRPLLYKSML